MKQTWDQYLVAEHEMIERAIDVLKKELEALEPGAHPSRRLGRAVDFLATFGDKIHNRKEEDYLFPLMEKKGIPREGGPIGVMINEHKMERELLARFFEILASFKKLSGEQVDSMKKEGLEYMKIRAEHIWKENDVLYAMGRNIFSPDDARYLIESFVDLDKGTYGHEFEKKYSNMLEEVESGGQGMRLIDKLSYDQIHAIMETLPVEVTFVDAEDTVTYFNRLDKEKIFVRTRSVIGRKVEMCHPQKSVDKVKQIVSGFKSGTLDKAEFWIDMGGDTILIRYFPVKNDEGDYLGVLEVTQSVGWIRKLEGEKRLLDQ
ncbi:MAG: DUF438 domain-containing protein [Deltaproteobacteria bacterium]|nr:DUF438 domain-containing protein [Deltaproteobacteria bacterium]